MGTLRGQTVLKNVCPKRKTKKKKKGARKFQKIMACLQYAVSKPLYLNGAAKERERSQNESMRGSRSRWERLESGHAQRIKLAGVKT